MRLITSTGARLWLLCAWAAICFAEPAFKSGPFEVKSRHYRVLTDIDREAAVLISKHLEAINRQYVDIFAAFLCCRRSLCVWDWPWPSL